MSFDSVTGVMWVADVLPGMSLSGIGVNNDGEPYVLANSTGTPYGSTGTVLRLSPPATVVIQADDVGTLEDEQNNNGSSSSSGIVSMSFTLLGWFTVTGRGAIQAQVKVWILGGSKYSTLNRHAIDRLMMSKYPGF